MVDDGVGECGDGVFSLWQRGEIEGSDLVAAVGLNGQVNVLGLWIEIGIGEVEGDGDGVPCGAAVDGSDLKGVVWIVNIGGVAQEVAGECVDGDACLEVIF